MCKPIREDLPHRVPRADRVWRENTLEGYCQLALPNTDVKSNAGFRLAYRLQAATNPSTCAQLLQILNRQSEYDHPHSLLHPIDERRLVAGTGSSPCTPLSSTSSRGAATSTRSIVPGLSRVKAMIGHRVGCGRRWLATTPPFKVSLWSIKGAVLRVWNGL